MLKQLLSINDFKTKTLQDRILDNPAAVYLYPNTPKEAAFTKMSKSGKNLCGKEMSWNLSSDQMIFFCSLCNLVDCSAVDGYFNADMQESIPP